MSFAASCGLLEIITDLVTDVPVIVQKVPHYMYIPPPCWIIPIFKVLGWFTGTGEHFLAGKI